MGVKFIWGEVKSLDGKEKTATIKPIFFDRLDTVSFDYCMICSGCNFGPFHSHGESLWFPTIHEDARKVSSWGHIDERFMEGRRRHILEEYTKLQKLEAQEAKILVVGAGFIGVEWVTELEYFFPQMKLTIIDFLPRCLGPLPDSAADYCSEYMAASGIKEFYECKYDPKSEEFWKKIELPGGADDSYGCIGSPDDWKLGKGMNPVPKISYPGEEQAIHACWNINILEKQRRGACCAPKNLKPTWWPWDAGMFATSLGPHDACFVLAANHEKGSGYMVNWWIPAALQKEVIESTKINECKDEWIGILIWHFVHHTPVHLFGKGRFIP